MLCEQDNNLLCRTGPETPMGNLFRRFWLPVAFSVSCRSGIADRTKEHLGSSDAGVIALRRRLLNAVRNLEHGAEPTEPRRAHAYRVHPTATVVSRRASFENVARVALPLNHSFRGL